MTDEAQLARVAWAQMQKKITNPDQTRRGAKNNYVGLPELLNDARALLSEHGFILFCNDADTLEMVGVRWTVVHVQTGHVTAESVQFCPRDQQSITPAEGKARGAMNIFQAHGSGKKYLKRIGLQTLLCVSDVNERDIDDAGMFTPEKLPATLATVEQLIEEMRAVDNPSASQLASFKTDCRTILMDMGRDPKLAEDRQKGIRLSMGYVNEIEGREQVPDDNQKAGESNPTEQNQ